MFWYHRLARKFAWEFLVQFSLINYCTLLYDWSLLNGGITQSAPSQFVINTWSICQWGAVITFHQTMSWSSCAGGILSVSHWESVYLKIPTTPTMAESSHMVPFSYLSCVVRIYKLYKIDAADSCYIQQGISLRCVPWWSIGAQKGIDTKINQPDTHKYDRRVCIFSVKIHCFVSGWNHAY